MQHRLTGSQIGQIRRMRNGGFKLRQIAEEVGVTPQTIHYHLREIGEHRSSRDAGGYTSEELKHIEQITQKEFDLISGEPTEQEEKILTERIYEIARRIKDFRCSQLQD